MAIKLHRILLKKKYFFILLSFLPLFSQGQTVSSSCTATPQVLAMYQDDADLLTLRKIYQQNLSYKDSAIIPASHRDTIMNALVAVYNATSLPARDTVVNIFSIHAYEVDWFYPYHMNSIYVKGDTSYTWMQQLKNYTIPTGDPSMDQVISTFDLSISAIFPLIDVIKFQTGSNYNIPGLTKVFDTIPGVVYSEPVPVIMIMHGNQITATVFPGFVELVYSKGWDHCNVGCQYRRFWKFRVYHNCDVEYMGSYGDPLKCVNSGQITVNSCNTYTLNGYTYNQSGTYYQSIPSTGACDSLLRIDLNLDLVENTITETACDSFVFLGQTYFQSGIYTHLEPNANGCDTLHTLKLEIANTFSFLNDTACGLYFLNGIPYIESGKYTQTLTNAAGCDSIIHLDLTINPTYYFTITDSACKSITLNDITYTESGTYTQNFTNTKGCDSIIVLYLTLNKVDTSVMQSGFTFSSNANGASYQWIDCINPENPDMVMATGQSFTPEKNGSYAVIITQNNCTDTSACLVVNHMTASVNTIEKQENKFICYPNPFKDQITITSDIELENVLVSIMDLNGRVLCDAKPIKSKSFSMDLRHLSPGMYYIIINQNGNIERLKLVKGF